VDILPIIVIVVIVMGIGVTVFLNRQKAQRKKEEARRYTNDEGHTDLLMTEIKEPQEKQNTKR
jgi:hypothetical protein